MLRNRVILKWKTIFESFMKGVLYCVLILGLLFLHPRVVSACDIKKGHHFSGSFQKLQKEDLTISDNSSDAGNSFDNDLFTDDEDDDDINISAKKIFFSETACSVFAQHMLQGSCRNSNNRILRSPYFFHLSPSHFISLRVFRL